MISRWFRRKKSAAERLQEQWTCSSCGETHQGLFDLAAFAPDPWPGEEIYQPNSALDLAGDFLSEDFCVLAGEHFMVRCVLEIPVDGFAEKFGFGCWSTLSRTNFDKYIDAFDHGKFEDWGPWNGWLMNRFAGYIGDEPELVDVIPQPNRQRPTLVIRDMDHPLAIAQAEGISAERMLEIYEHYGHGETS